ncbi:MAG: hypothetical protein AB7F21_07530 [Desulfuromonadales bacterium]
MDIKKKALFALPALVSRRRLRCWFMTVFHGRIASCCHCGAILEGRALKSFLNFRITSCAACHKKVFFFRETPFHAAKIQQEEFILLAAFLALDVPIKDIAAALNLSESTVKEWAGKIDAFNDSHRSTHHEPTNG